MSTATADAGAIGAPRTHNLPAVTKRIGTGGCFLTSAEVLEEELAHFCGPRQAGDGRTWEARADDARLTALCLSGGGIRSATFCLGALQALAGREMLREFHYLSTVSGGGFAGGWLQVFIEQCGGILKAEETLKAAANEAFGKLREYTNYLTPDVGLLSRDTWAGIVLYVRNTVLNWLVILPLLLCVPLTLLFYRTGLEAASGRHADRAGADAASSLPLWLPLALGSAALLVATFRACIMLPSHRPLLSPGEVDPASGRKTRYASGLAIFGWIVVPTCLWAVALPFALRALFALEAPGPDGVLLASAMPLAWFGLSYFGVQVAAYLGGMAWQNARSRPGLWLYRRNLWPWLFASFVSAMLVWGGIRYGVGWLLAHGQEAFGHEDAVSAVLRPLLAALNLPSAARFDPENAQVSQILTVLAPPLLIAAHLAQSILFIGLRRSAERADLDREWVARADGQLLLAAVGWTALCLCCLVVPSFLLGRDRPEVPALLGTLGTLVTGPVAAFLGKQVFARAQTLAAKGRMDDLLMLGLSVMAAVFGISLFALMGWSLGWLLGLARDWWGDCLLPERVRAWSGAPAACGHDRYAISLIVHAGFAALLAGAVWLFGRVNVNRFSMHGVYRTRLTRGFLGSAREKRDADPFTDFDEDDSPRIAKLKIEKRLFPVVNMTLNLTDILRTEWAERKAASFTATPFACGSAILERPLDRPDPPGFRTARPEDAPGREDPPQSGSAPRRKRARPEGAYIRSSEYAGQESHGDTANAGNGPLLGGLLTISGAAVSPNWGYHSSRLIAFLMTLFNVRLGAWLPNPAVATVKDLRLAKPRNSVFALLNELRGLSTSVRQAVYLSDGGHFDNLGLYEMLRRRCARIVVIDAGQDEKCTFFDLGNVIRKAEVDGLVIKVQMGEMRILPRATIERDGKRAGALGYARGTIQYPGARDPASLIYIKPSFLDDIPAEVRAYGATSAAFPHESTTDQWFSESQFESYRALGHHQVSTMFGSHLTSLSEWSAYLDSEIGRRPSMT